MGLINKESIFDLVPGSDPVINMNGLQGPSFDLGPSSRFQIDSLQIVPQTIIYQDLDGLPGPSFDNGPEPGGPNLIDTLHEQSLQNGYSYLYGNTTANIAATTLGLGGGQGAQFDNGPEPNTIVSTMDTIHENSLENLYESLVNPGASYGAGQVGATWPAINPSSLDLGGAPGTQFDNGPAPQGNDIDTLQESALVEMYNSAVNPEASYGAGQPGSTYPNINATTLDMNGQVGPNFIPTFDVHQSLLTNTYQSTIILILVMEQDNQEEHGLIYLQEDLILMVYFPIMDNI